MADLSSGEVDMISMSEVATDHYLIFVTWQPHLPVEPFHRAKLRPVSLRCETRILG
jgi:hypothetical protein